MSNAINNQFKMTPGSKEVSTEGTFKMDKAVLNMGVPTNYGTPSDPLNKLDDDPDKKTPGVGEDGMTDYARKRKAKIEAGKKKQAELAKKRAEAKKKRESGEYTPPKGRSGDFNFLGIKGNTKRYGEGG